jgi:putative ABC transport system permease protein
MSGLLQTWFARTWHRFVFRWRRDELARELEQELDFHFAQKQAENRRAGLEPQFAAELSRRQMGNITVAKEDCRDMWSFMRWERVLQDLRHAMRMYGRTPVFTAVCVLSLAVGIGGNAAMFSLVNALLVRPLPYAQPDRLVRITGIYPRAALPFFQERSRTMEIAAISAGSEINLTGQGEASRFFGSNASSNFLSVLGASVALGRDFQPGEDNPGRDHVVIISHSIWKERFSGDASAVGRVIKLNGVDREIIGVMPAGFGYPSAKVQLWFPMRLDQSNFLEYWGTEFMPLVARLRPDASLTGAQGEVRSLNAQFKSMYPYPMPRDFNAGSTAIPLQQDLVGDVRGRLLILLCSVAAVLLIACANVAGLLLSRATTRRKEMALRAALGAGRLRIVRQLLTESIGLALTGATLGILLGMSALSLFKSVLPQSLPGLAQAKIDWQIVGAVTALALLSGLVSGFAPALSASRVDITETIKTGSQRSTSGFWTRLRGGIIVGEVALTLVLLIGAGLLLRSVYSLSVVSPGFGPTNLLTVQISPNQSSCVQREVCIALYDRLLQRAAEVPGVGGAAVANSIPLDGRVPTIPVDVEDHPKTAEFPAPMLWLEAVSPAYLQMMHIPLLAGRYLTDNDRANSAPVLVIPASTAKRFWPTQSALGKHIKVSESDVWRTVVGVVGDVNHFTLSQRLPSGVSGVVYMPYPQSIQVDGQIPVAMTLLAKVESGHAAYTARSLEQLARDLDPNVPVGRAQALEDMVAGSISDIRSTMLVFVSFAGAAIVLAAVGLYGLMSYWVSQRTYEIGLRVAIGCSRPGIMSMILARGMRLTLYGVIGGILGALMLTHFLTSLLFGVAANDALTFLAVTAVVLGVGVIATAFPAWRAARIDPIKALRVD